MALTDKDLQRMSEILYRERIAALEEENEKKAVFIAHKNTKLAEWRKENERLKAAKAKFLKELRAYNRYSCGGTVDEVLEDILTVEELSSGMNTDGAESGEKGE